MRTIDRAWRFVGDIDNHEVGGKRRCKRRRENFVGRASLLCLLCLPRTMPAGQHGFSIHDPAGYDKLEADNGVKINFVDKIHEHIIRRRCANASIMC